METMEYKGYRGAVRYSAEDRILHGRILGIDDVVNFEGADVDELEKAFHQAVDDYLALCKTLRRAPDREYSGRIPLRIDAGLHRRVAIAADSEGSSVNSWIAGALEAATKPLRPATSGTIAAARGAGTARGRSVRGRIAQVAARKPAKRKKPRATARKSSR
jgi:predicted HicB family RNase H-like nuclease